MRNQIKQLLKKENGFTLVELLAVLAILALIVGISIPLIGKVIDNSTAKANETEQALVLDAARLYYMDEKNSNEDEVSTEKLMTEGYLEKSYDGTLEKVTKIEAENGSLGKTSEE